MNKNKSTISNTAGSAVMLLLIGAIGVTSILFSTALAQSATLGEPIFVEKGADTIQREIGPNRTQYTITNNVTTESPLLCNDGSSPESSTGLCSDGLPPSFNFSFCDPNSPTLRINSTGNKVSELQLHLTQLGYGELLKPPGIDGKFGPFTQNAVKAFQRDNDLQIDGIVGPMTWGAICKAISSISWQSLSAAPQQSEENAAPMQISPVPETPSPFVAQQAIDNVTAKSPPPESSTGLCPDGNDEAWINVARDGDTAASNCETVHSDVNP